MPIDRFTVRVYGLLVHGGRVLVSHEWIKGRMYTKFPGGGLEFGEGPAQAVVREFEEEARLAVSVKSHLYTNDFFIASAFSAQHQVVAIYYLVDARSIPAFTAHWPTEQDVMAAGQVLQWAELNAIGPTNFSFEADRAALAALKLRLNF